MQNLVLTDVFLLNAAALALNSSRKYAGTNVSSILDACIFSIYVHVPKTVAVT